MTTISSRPPLDGAVLDKLQSIQNWITVVSLPYPRAKCNSLFRINRRCIFFADCLSDRELRRVAYKLNGEEWSHLGTFLGVGDRDLVQLGGLTMGPQEKAFRLLCVWRTRCRLGRSQMISQLAVSLEEVNRKDVAQFVLEQFMSGKPRKKLFGW